MSTETPLIPDLQNIVADFLDGDFVFQVMYREDDEEQQTYAVFNILSEAVECALSLYINAVDTDPYLRVDLNYKRLHPPDVELVLIQLNPTAGNRSRCLSTYRLRDGLFYKWRDPDHRFSSDFDHLNCYIDWKTQLLSLTSSFPTRDCSVDGHLVFDGCTTCQLCYLRVWRSDDLKHNNINKSVYNGPSVVRHGLFVHDLGMNYKQLYCVQNIIHLVNRTKLKKRAIISTKCLTIMMAQDRTTDLILLL